MTIQWFPGHMTRARRQIEEKLKLIDVAIELLDARLPLSSRNPMIDDILKDKPRLVLLNKTDLADPRVTEQWVSYFADKGLKALPIDASSGHRVNEIQPRAEELMAEKFARWEAKGVNPRAVRILIVGIPNVGKSTLINRLAGRKVAATGDRPGVTKGQQWIRVGTGIELLDTPGILWPKFEDQKVGYRLAASGAIKEEILNVEDVAFHLTGYLADAYPGLLQDRYDLGELETLPDPESEFFGDAVVGVMEQIGRRRGCLQGGGIVNLEKASRVLLRDLQTGKLGRISLEKP
ncbi:ribosome biogenesis GTPase YlqF [Paenibacillus turpanensis]|uniref:ribosome biogenesis GTPase YlqF n=1 Tax=Paenibacillus turpanensis TaxID=2689078 RepID=UPI00140C7A2F|nr:ribosome biogenesis GTPase YlqF [Paenibacillus turpanensis]